MELSTGITPVSIQFHFKGTQEMNQFLLRQSWSDGRFLSLLLL
jgi:hypothetical protein